MTLRAHLPRLLGAAVGAVLLLGVGQLYSRVGGT